MAIFGLFGGSKDEAPRPDQLDKWIADTLKRELGLDEVVRDDEGDFPIRWGSVLVYVSVLDLDGEVPHIHIFAQLLENFTMRPEVYEAVNAINLQVPVAKAFVEAEGDQIVLAADIFIFEQLSSDQLMATIQLVGDRADYYDTMLQKRFGGDKTFDDDENEEFNV